MTDLPHAPYITAVVHALTTAGLDPADVTLDDSDTRGTYCYLRALMRFTPEATYGMTQEMWPHGLLLIWEWHTGIEADQGEPERGPVWLWAKCLSDGSNREPSSLPVPGFANPVQVAWALAELINHAEPGRQRIGQWTGASALNTACEAWAVEETYGA